MMCFLENMELLYLWCSWWCVHWSKVFGMYSVRKELNLNQRWQLELLKDYENSILYHQVKANVVVDSLRWFCMSITVHVEEVKKEVAIGVHIMAQLRVRLMDSNEWGVVGMNDDELPLMYEVKEKQDQELLLLNWSQILISRKYGLWTRGICCIKVSRYIVCTKGEWTPREDMEEAHSSKYSTNPGSEKMYCYLREVYWWSIMKRCILRFVAKFLNCQQVKVEH